MKDWFAFLLQFALAYGVKDKERFRRHATEFLDSYQLEEKSRNELIEFAYEFITNLNYRLLQTQITAEGVRQGSDNLEKKLDELTEKLEAIRKEIKRD